MPKLDDAIKAEHEDWKRRFLSQQGNAYPERNRMLAQDILDAALEEWGEVWIGSKLAGHADTFDTVIRQYTGEMGSDDWDFLVPCDDFQLRQMLVAHRLRGIDEKHASWEAIKQHILELKGVPF